METYISILITQLPIAFACLWGAYEIHLLRKFVEEIRRKKK
ncbi:MAG: hypothetical protein NTV63_02815 [Candidatus Woesearchaeota archaeon]|nr:hypothetical protein [Candidatus Woesearchaeota archaeon]